MTTDTPVAIATAYIEAFGTGDTSAIGEFLAPDVSFSSPRAQLSGYADVLAAVGEFAQVVQRVEIIAALGDERQAVVVYDMVTGPFGTLRVVDHVVVEEGKVREDCVVFDTQPLLAAQE